MANPLQFTTTDLQVFLLAWFRITGILLVGPVFGTLAVPPTLKAVFGLLFTMIFFPLLPRVGGMVEPNLALYVLWVGLELGVGLLIGFAASLVFAAVQLGGQLIDQELGLSLATVFDPISSEPVSVVAQFKLMLATIVYLLIDGHHFLLSATAQSFASIPLLGLRIGDAVAFHLSDTMMRDLFVISLKIAAPAMVTLFLLTIAMAFMARAVPEMNLFAVGFSLRLLVGFLVLALGISVFVFGFERTNGGHENSLRVLLRLMGT